MKFLLFQRRSAVEEKKMEALKIHIYWWLPCIKRSFGSKSIEEKCLQGTSIWYKYKNHWIFLCQKNLIHIKINKKIYILVFSYYLIYFFILNVFSKKGLLFLFTIKYTSLCFCVQYWHWRAASWFIHLAYMYCFLVSSKL